MTKKNSKPEPAKAEETKAEETKVEDSNEESGEDSNEEKGPQEVPVSYIKGRRHNATGPIGSRRPR